MVITTRSKISILLLTLFLASSCLFISCSKEGGNSDYTFSGSCDFGSYDSRQVNRQEARLHFTDSIGDMRLGEYRYILISDYPLPMVICNPPVDLEMGERESISVRFSGKVLIPAPNELRIATDVELSYLKLL